jgi:hypothetical protein
VDAHDEPSLIFRLASRATQRRSAARFSGEDVCAAAPLSLRGFAAHRPSSSRAQQAVDPPNVRITLGILDECSFGAVAVWVPSYSVE